MSTQNIIQTPRKKLSLCCQRQRYSSTQPRHYLDLYRLDLPTSPGQEGDTLPNHLIVFIHGGAWRSNSPDQFSEQASLLFDHAAHPDQLAVAIPAYRLSLAPDWPQHPAHLDDLTQALTHLSSQGVTRLHLIGHSCGATLAAQLTLDHRIPPNLQLQSVAGIEGIYDLPALVNDFPSYADHFVNDAFGKDPAQWTKASPAHMILSPSACFAPIPWLLIQSMEDELINLTQTSLFAHALAQAHPAQTVTVDSTSLTGAHDPCLSNSVWAILALSHAQL